MPCKKTLKTNAFYYQLILSVFIAVLFMNLAPANYYYNAVFGLKAVHP